MSRIETARVKFTSAEKVSCQPTQDFMQSKRRDASMQAVMGAGASSMQAVMRALVSHSMCTQTEYVPWISPQGHIL